MAKRATIYFDATTHKALRLKAAEKDQTVSELVNAAVRRSLAEDADDLGHSATALPSRSSRSRSSSPT